MEREYLRVKPSRESLNPDEIVRNIASLHKLAADRDGGGLLSRNSKEPPVFEFLAVSEGPDEPVKFYIGTDEEFMDTLETDMETSYPNSFDIDREVVDLEEFLIPSIQYKGTDEYLDEFGDRIEDWDAIEMGDPVRSDEVVEAETQELRVADETGIELPGNPEPVTDADGDAILARPDLDDVSPVVIEWQGNGDRKRDWMTTIKRFTSLMEPDDDEIENRNPLARLIQEVAKAELPTVFQVTFQRKSSWKEKADKRRKDLHLKRDTRKQKIAYEVSEALHPSNKETRKEKRRSYLEEEGESSKKDQTADVGDIGPRAALIDDKHPKRTFNVNIRAGCVSTRRVPVEDAKEEMQRLRHVLDALDGQFYSLENETLVDKKGRIRDKPKATKAVERMLNRDLAVDKSGHSRREIVLNADELANFVVAPSSKGLTVEGTRETRAKPESRNPLPRPDPDIMEDFHEPGMRVGYALDEDSQPEDIPTQIPPGLLKTHYGRFATTGAGKSKALQNDMLSLYENTDGPVMLIDPKGDGMAENYLRAHWKRYGDLDNVYYFPVPDILPGFSFFNIDPALDNGQRRVDAVQNKSDHYEEILKLVMGAEKYGESKVAPNIIKSLIKALFDEEYGLENGSEREDTNYFGHHDLELSAMQLRAAASDDDEGRVPEVSDERIHETLTRHLLSMESDFAVIMDAVFNRLDYIKQDAHLRRIFDNTDPKFDFRDLLDEDAVVLFDLGDLRQDAALIMTGLILTNLWDALQESKRENWAENHVVNCIIDEASSVAVSDIMNNMLEKGRGFNLSVGLAMQFPEQMRAISETAYMNVLNNVGSMLIGKIPLDREVAEAMAHEDMDPEEFRNRFKSLPRGEWIAQLPSPQFKQTGPEPFSLDPMPIPAGHDESDTPLTQPEKKAFDEAMLPQTLQRTQEQFGIDDEAGGAIEGPNAEDILGDSDDSEGGNENVDSGTDNSEDGGSDAVSDGEANSSGGETSSDSGGVDGRVGGSIDDDATDAVADSFGRTANDTPEQDTRESDASSETAEATEKSNTDVVGEALEDGEAESPTRPGTSDSDSESSAESSGASMPPGHSSDSESEDSPPDPSNLPDNANKGDSDGSTSNGYSRETSFGDTQADGGGESTNGFGSITTDNTKQEENSNLSGSETPAPKQSGQQPDENSESDEVPPPEEGFQTEVEELMQQWTEEEIYEVAEDIARSGRGSDSKLSMMSALATRSRMRGHDIEVQKDFSELVTDYVFGSVGSDTESESAQESDDMEETQQSGGGTGNLNVDPVYPIDSQASLSKYNLTREEGAFLQTVIEAINGDTEYPLTETMTTIKNAVDVDVERLETDGFIKSHNLVKRGVWYTPLTKAQDAVGVSRKTGRWYGDTGEDTPHKVAVEVTRQYIEHLPGVDRAESYYPLQKEEVADVAGLDANGEVTYVVEIEMGELNTRESGGDYIGTQNRAAVHKDYEQMAAGDAEVWWVMQNSDVADAMLRHLNNPVNKDGEVVSEPKLNFDSIISGPVARKRKQLHGENLAGIDLLFSLTEVWDALDSGEDLREL